MARQSQKERINLLCEMIAEIADTFVLFLTGQVTDEVAFVEQIRELRALAATVADEDSYLKLQKGLTDAVANPGAVLSKMESETR